MTFLLAVLALAQPPANGASVRPKPFVLLVADAQTGRGVPAVELRTVNNVLYITDSAGLVTIDDPGLMNQNVFLGVKSFGYELPADGFGNRGKAFKIVPGGDAKLNVTRTILAERIYRITGEGIYRDTVLAGRNAPIREPLLNAGVLGQDSILAAIFEGEIHWFWGDTNRFSYPLGNFHTPGATSLLPDRGGLDPNLGVDLNYYADETGFAKATAKLPGDGPTWLTGLTVVHDKQGREHMFATYDKVRNTMETYRRGLVEWDASKKEFHAIAEFPLNAPIYPEGHPFLHKVNGTEYVYFAAPLPLTRVKADPDSIKDLAQYEAFTPYLPGAKTGAKTVERDAMGRVVYGWKKNTAPAKSGDFEALLNKTTLKVGESLLAIRDDITMRPVVPHRGSVNWNAFRKRWIAIFVSDGGVSPLGEVYYAEADTPLGPWIYTRRIASHSLGSGAYSFYNPKHHLFFDKDSGRTIFFEGTYANTFSGNPDQTPRYDYNQIMYKLDLAKPELALPVPIYVTTDAGEAGPIGPGAGYPERHGNRVLFCAPDQQGKGTVPVHGVANAAGGQDLVVGKRDGDPLFYVLPPGPKGIAVTTTELWEFVHDDGVRHAYSIETDWTSAGFRRTGRVIGFVWKNPIKMQMPRE